MAKRIYEIAKELGVPSKAIIEKCRAEGIPGIKNAQSTVKLGLEQTIREWFSTGPHNVTAVETAPPVKLDDVRQPFTSRAKATRTRGETPVSEKPGEPSVKPVSPPVTAQAVKAVAQTTTEEKAATESATATVATTEATARRPTEGGGTTAEEVPAGREVAVATVGPQKGTAETAVQEPTAAPGVAATTVSAPPSAPPKPAEPTKPAPPPAEVKPAGMPNIPARPTVVTPAGPRLEKPQEVRLRGPTIVRIEKPEETLPPVRPKRPAGGLGGVGPVPPSIPGIRSTRGSTHGRGAGTVMDDELEGRPATKRRVLSTRRGRSATADIRLGPSQLTEADLLELDAKLRGAAGYVKLRRRELKKHEAQQAAAPTPAVVGGKVEIQEPITIKSLSAATGIKAADIIKYLFQKGLEVTINSAISAEMAMEVAMEHNIELVVKEQQSLAEKLLAAFENRPQIDVRRRPPVVTVMGHVDHGKTTLLDRIRQSDVAAHEAGGITQHIGAYRVTIEGSDGKPKTVVFLDTPGHEAFTSLRARGASVTDLVVLVVAADDGVMPQTVESIHHAQAAGVPIIVALNKIDKPEATEANIRKIYGQLAEHGLQPTEWGGQTEVIKVSAVQGTGIRELLEILDLQAELLDLKADYGGPARGTVIEALMSPGRGPVARALVQQGTLRVGDVVVCGRAFGRVRDLTDDRGQSIKEAGPATPVEISGLDMLCDAGDKFYVTESLQQAEEIARQFREHERQRQLASQAKLTLESFAAAMKAGGGPKELRVVLKADVQGSVDVLKKSLEELGNQEVAVKVLHAAVGGVTESDVLLADASEAVIIGFNVVAPAMVRELAEQRRVQIRLYRVIYEIMDDVKKALEGMLEPETREEILGTAEVRQVFRISKVGMVAGCLVTDGVIQRGAKVRVARDGVVVVDERQIESLKRLKDDVREVRAGLECGIRIAGFDDVKVGDKVIAYQTVQVRRKLGE